MLGDGLGQRERNALVLPDGPADLMAAGRPSELARVAEESGWHGFAVTEHPTPAGTAR